MPEESVSKSLPDQIMEKALDALRQREEFDGSIVSGLEGLYKAGRMDRADSISEILKEK